MDWTPGEVREGRRVRSTRDGVLGTIVEVKVTEGSWVAGRFWPSRLYARIRWDDQEEASVGYYSWAGADLLDPADGA